MASGKVMSAMLAQSALVIGLLFTSWPAHAADWIFVPGGEFFMGDPHGDANEQSSFQKVKPFEMMRLEVTNQAFHEFVTNTHYRTDVQRNGEAYVWAKRWEKDASAHYQQPHGRNFSIGSSVKNIDDHPVVQVSARDAQTYCMYHGWRLPSEIEWEYAARGTDGRRYPWGNQPPQQSPINQRANFGTVACCDSSDTDGYQTTSPVGSYPAGESAMGLLDMAGNVWEWTSSTFPGRAHERVIRGGGWGNNPYCLRVSYRHGNPPNIGLNMVGFRCARQPTAAGS